MPVPVGLVTCGVPDESSDAYWDASGWGNFCSKLMKEFKKGRKELRLGNDVEQRTPHLSKDVRVEHDVLEQTTSDSGVRLEYDVVEQTTSDFKAFVVKCNGWEISLPSTNIVHPATEPEEKIVSGLRRRLTTFSQSSTSSTKSIENISIGYVKLHEQEEKKITNFLKSHLNQNPRCIPRPVTGTVYRSTSTQKETIDISPPSIDSGGGEIAVPQLRPDDTHKTAGSEEKFPEEGHKMIYQIVFSEDWPDRTTQYPSNQDEAGRSSSIREVSDNKALALWYFEQGDLDEARRLYIFTVKHLSFGKDESYNLAKIFWIEGHYSKAADIFSVLLNSAQDISEDTSSYIVWTYDVGRWLALTHWKRGKYDVAATTIDDCRMKVKIWTSESSSVPQDEPPTLLSTLALIRAAKGEFKAAWKLSKKAAAEAKEHVEKADYRFCLLNHARISSEIGEFKEAEEKSKEVYRDFQEYLGPKHFVTLDAASLRAWLMVLRNNPTQVEEEIQRTLRQTRELLGEDHPTTLQVVQTLILLYKGDGRYVDAEVTARYLVEKCEMNPELKSDHPQTLKSKSILAEVLLATGKWSEAELIQREVLSQEKDNFLFRTSLADIFRVKGDWDAARGMAIKVLCMEILRFSSDDVGDDDPEVYDGEMIEYEVLQGVLRMSGYIAKYLSGKEEGDSPFKNMKPVRVYPALVRDDADLRFVDSILSLLLGISQKKLGPDHRLTLNLEHDLAVNLRLRGEVKESLEKLNSIVDARRKSLGADHPDYLVSRYQRAVTLSRCFQWQKALEEQKTVLKVQEALLGVSHFDTVMTRYSLAVVYNALNRLTEASDLIKRVISDQERLYKGESPEDLEHPLVIRTRCKYALILLKQGQAQDAEREQMRVYEQRRISLSDGHCLTRTARIDLAQIKQALGKYEDAIAIYKELQNEFKNSDSQTEYQLKTSLASCYFGMGRFNNEIERFKDAMSLQIELYNGLGSTISDSRLSSRLIIAAFNLSLTCKEIQKREKAHRSFAEAAYRLLFEAASIADRVYGNDHPRTEELRATVDIWKKELLNQCPSSISESDVRTLEDMPVFPIRYQEPQDTAVTWPGDAKIVLASRDTSTVDVVGTESTSKPDFTHTQDLGIVPKH
ncbi:hypothetical protein E8E13_003831 [Curvularia kusanoi]|uniref:Uncharacterized protein n=1 Tax=Curvularia kusanoi TaxID=90978 RepID=A0A9P4T6D4_CURKU|nr:hypothetical protein E8E13_003831 [Curvularia kusanoi]